MNNKLPPSDRIFGEQVAIGEPFRVDGDQQLRQEIESSLQLIARQRLSEADEQAKACIRQAKAQAKQILAEAKMETEQLVAQAESNVASITESAREQGFKSGFQEGFQDATSQVSQESVALLQGAQTLVEGAYQVEKQVLQGFEERAIALIHHVVSQILCRELKDTPHDLMRMVQQAVEHLYLNGKVQVVVSPLILQDLRTYSDETQQGLDLMSRFEFIADAALSREQIYIIGQEGCFDISPLSQAHQLLLSVEGDFKLD